MRRGSRRYRRSTSSEIVDVFLLSQVHVPVPLVGLAVFAVASVVQLPGFENFAVIDAVALLTPPPTHPPILAPVDLTVDTTIVLLESFGSAGVNVAEPARGLARRPANCTGGCGQQTNRQHHGRRQQNPCNLAHAEHSLIGYRTNGLTHPTRPTSSEATGRFRARRLGTGVNSDAPEPTCLPGIRHSGSRSSDEKETPKGEDVPINLRAQTCVRHRARKPVMRVGFTPLHTTAALARRCNCRTIAVMTAPSTSSPWATREGLENLYRELAPAVLGYLPRLGRGRAGRPPRRRVRRSHTRPPELRRRSGRGPTLGVHGRASPLGRRATQAA